ncbi:MAG: hypothetical protein JPMHGGIA_00568 [Saprospiraceae bacterium]|nr:hypothetical protein [Saprospiraceae bacterium]
MRHIIARSNAKRSALHQVHSTNIRVIENIVPMNLHRSDKVWARPRLNARLS